MHTQPKPRISKNNTKTPSAGPVSGSPNSLFDGILENAHQFGLRDSSLALDIVIGLDFGTSSTKAVVHAPRYSGNPAYAVPFGNLAHSSLRYLLPTRLSVSKDGLCSLSNEPNASILTDIKIGLMRSPGIPVDSVSGVSCSATARTIATAYLALVLRYVRCWFISNKRGIFEEYRINWTCNLGLPAAIDDDPILRETFNLVGKAAWLVSRRNEPITINGSLRAIEDVKHSRFEEEDMPWDFELIPEVIAEVTGYARSEFRNEGLHFLIDVGASTLDVCAFNLRENEGDDHFSIYTTEVELLGAKFLHLERVERAKSATVKNAERIFDGSDPLSIIPNELSDYIPDEATLISEIELANQSFISRSGNAIHKTIWHTRSRRDPNSARWSEFLPIFVCGGGKSVDAYQNAVTKIDGWLKRFIPSCPGVRLVSLLKPESLDADTDNETYHRLAVAWGLSHESFNIGTYDRPSEIPDIPPPQVRNLGGRYISKDMV